jgi:cobalt-zinc-cadmium resistance protein CzcA
MVENCIRRLERAERITIDERRALITRAAFEVGRPVVFGICIIIAVYVPVCALQGLEGRMFAPMAFTVCAAVLGSLLLALTYVPMACSFLMHRAVHTPSRWFETLHDWYRSPRWGGRSSRPKPWASLPATCTSTSSLATSGARHRPRRWW